MRCGLIGAETNPIAGAREAPPRASVLTATVAVILLLSLLASIHLWRSAATGADLHVLPDGAVPVVVCVVGGTHARCLTGSDEIAGRIDGGARSLCGLANRRLDPACAPGRECGFAKAAPAGAFGLVLLAPRSPAFGVPRNRVIDTAVLARGDAPAAERIAAGVQQIARCFAPSDTSDPTDVVLHGGACERTPCRLRHSRVRIAADSTRAPSVPPEGGDPTRSAGG
jgi:hypothetical protein